MQSGWLIVGALVVFIMVTSRFFMVVPTIRHVTRGSEEKGLDDTVLGSGDQRKGRTDTKSNQLWIVFDASEYDGELQFLEPAKRWNILVVGVSEPELRQSCPSCIFIDDKWLRHSKVRDLLTQAKVSGDTIIAPGDTPRVAALLFAIDSGADGIFLTNQPFAPPLGHLERAYRGEYPTGVIFDEKDVFEPCDHFMDPYVWQGKLTHLRARRYTINRVSQRAVYAPVTHCYTKMITKSLHTEAFDDRGSKPFVTAGHFAAVDFRNIFLPREAFWLLVTSFMIEGTDLRARSTVSFLLQRLLWETATDLGFFPYQPSDSYHENVKRNCQTCRIYKTSQQMLKDLPVRLAHWRCNVNNTFEYCAHKLMTSFAPWLNDIRFDDEMLTIWFEMLRSVRNSLPSRKAYDFNKQDDRGFGIPVLYAPSKRLIQKEEFVVDDDTSDITNPISDILRDDGKLSYSEMTRPRDSFHKLCQRGNVTYRAIIPRKHKIQNILLVVVLNWAEYVRDIPHLEMMHGRHFRHVVYCTEVLSSFGRHYNQSASPVTYIEVNHFRGHRGYECMSAAMKMGYDVDGYLQMGDDVLLNVWNLKTLPLHEMWLPRLRVGDVKAANVPDVGKQDNWIPWAFDVGRATAATSLKALESMTSYPVVGPLVKTFISRLRLLTKCDSCVMYEASDIFYVPDSLKFEFIFFTNVFAKHKLFLEIAVPTTLAGLSHQTSVHRLKGKYVWYADRERYDELYEYRDIFYHSWKLSTLETYKGARFFCNVYLRHLDSDLKEQPIKLPLS